MDDINKETVDMVDAAIKKDKKHYLVFYFLGVCIFILGLMVGVSL